MHPSDVVDFLVGIEPGSVLDGIRRGRPVTRDNIQASHMALFLPEDAGNVPLAERFLIATFVCGLHQQASEEAFYRQGYLGAGGSPELREAAAAEVIASRTEGPYGSYPEGPLSIENEDGLQYRVSPQHAARFGTRLSAALEHAHFLVFHPRDAQPAALENLSHAGWTTDGIVTLSQLLAFLSFQLRIISGLRKLASTQAKAAA